MRKEIFSPEQSKEQEPSPSKEIWLVDDDKEITEAILGFWKRRTKDIAYKFKYFETAQSALDEIKTRKGTDKKLPEMIFVDGELKKDKAELNRGVSFIEKIREMKEIKQPKIVAHSAEKDFNDEMQKAGADFAFRKTDFMKSAEFLKDPEHYEKEGEKT